MSELFKKLSSALGRLRGRREVPEREDRRRDQRLVCSMAVLWEAGRQHGEGVLREVSATGLRLRIDVPLLAGRNIRIRPLKQNSEPLSLDVAIGTVVYSRRRRESVEVGVELINPDRISRFAWLNKLRNRGGQPRGIQTRTSGKLRLVSRTTIPPEAHPPNVGEG